MQIPDPYFAMHYKLSKGRIYYFRKNKIKYKKCDTKRNREKIRLVFKLFRDIEKFFIKCVDNPDKNASFTILYMLAVLLLFFQLNSISCLLNDMFHFLRVIEFAYFFVVKVNVIALCNLKPTTFRWS